MLSKECNGKKIIKRIVHSPIADFISMFCFDKAWTQKKPINLDLACFEFLKSVIGLHTIPLTNDLLHFLKTDLKTKRLKQNLVSINFPDQNSPKIA